MELKYKMGKLNIFEWLKEFIGGICFKIFIWSINMTDDQYWNEVYEHEKKYRSEKGKE